jgi:hypothetical protein
VPSKKIRTASHPKKEEVTPDGHLIAPKGQDARDSVVLVGEYRKPDYEVIPAHGHGEGWVDHAISKLRKGATRGIQSREFSQALHDAITMLAY